MRKGHQADTRLPSPHVWRRPPGPSPAPTSKGQRALVSGAEGGAHRERGELMVAQEASPGSGNSDRHRQAATKTTGITPTRTHTHTSRSAHATLCGKGEDHMDCAGWCVETRVLDIGKAAAGGWLS